jgi:hypothetical protein
VADGILGRARTALKADVDTFNGIAVKGGQKPIVVK